MTASLMKNSAFLQDVERARKANDTFHLWWLGRNGFLLKWHERHLIMDPVLSAPAKPEHAPEQREATSVVAPVELDFIDIATISYIDDQHPDRSTIRGIWTVSPAMRLVVPAYGSDSVASHLGIHPALPLGIKDGDTVSHADFEISAVATTQPSAGAASDTTNDDLGYVYQFGNGFTLFHCSRISVSGDLVERLKAFKVDVALLPLRSAENPNGLESAQAVEFANQIEAGLLIPHTADSPALQNGFGDTLRAEAERMAQPIHLLQPGERWSNAK